MMAVDYQAFLDAKRNASSGDGHDVDITDINPELRKSGFEFQADLVQWALAKGRAAIFADTGLGKTPMQLEWARLVHEHTGGNVLILTPLAVAHQTISEGVKFGIDVQRSTDGTAYQGITVANYERLHMFKRDDFVALVCDESAILKNFDGVRRNEITAFMRGMQYRLLCSATPAPNDYTELGTSSEALGYLGHVDMLNKFFVNDRNNTSNNRMHGKMAEWRFKGHAEREFWRWVCSWARAIRKPSDLGYDDSLFDLPPLTEREHVVKSRTAPEGMLFPVDAVNLQEQRAERRRTITERCEKVAELVDHDQPALVWAHLNDEGDMLERMIPDAVQVSGSESDEVKEQKLLAFANGETRVLITKPKIAGWGLNFQHCAHVTFFPSHSFEQYYQGVRRCWRFGQTRSVTVDVVTTEGEQRVLANLQRKAQAAERMFSQLVELMNDSLAIEQRERFAMKEEVPGWL